MFEDILSEERQIAEEQDDRGMLESSLLHCPLGELPQLQPPLQVPPETSIRDVIQRMIERRVGCITIVDSGRLVGVFSERDVLTKVATTGIDQDNTPVSRLMTRDPQTLSFDSPLVYALHQMTIGGYRHIPLVDEQHQPVAVISMRDIVAYLVHLYPDHVLKLPSEPTRSLHSSREGA